MREALRALDQIGPVGERKIRIGIAKDGSGVGAALIALVAASMERKSKAGTEDYIGALRGQYLQSVKEDVAVGSEDSIGETA